VTELRSFLDLSEVRMLLERAQPSGILTVYLDPESGYRHEAQRWQTQLNSGLTSLGQRYPDDRHLQQAIRTAAAEIGALPPEHRHRSLVYMRGLDPDWRWIRSLHGPVGTRFAWAPRPRIFPLLDFLHRFATVGVILGSRRGLQARTWRQGLLEPGPEWPLSVDTDDWRRFLGGAVPHLEQQRMTHVDSFMSRFIEQLKRALAALSPTIQETAAELGWQHLMVFGPQRLRDYLLGALPAPWNERSIPVPDRHLARVGSKEVADAVVETLTAWRDEQDDAAVTAVITAAAGGGPASAGVQEVLDLLAQDRVARLYVAADLELSGYRLPDGALRLHVPRDRQQDFAAEPDLVEAMAAAALRSGAGIVPVHGSAAGRLRQRGGVAAELRY